MVQRLFRAYDEIPDGTQCHRKTYITTALGGLLGERGPGRGGHAEVEGCRPGRCRSMSISGGVGPSSGIGHHRGANAGEDVNICLGSPEVLKRRPGVAQARPQTRYVAEDGPGLPIFLSPTWPVTPDPPASAAQVMG